MKLSNLQKKLEKSEQYLPAEDTFFLADQLTGLSGNSALDIGCGSGYLTDVLKSAFDLVVGTDISFNTLLEQNYKTQNVICCNSADALNQIFDLIICNLPYLATDEIIDVAKSWAIELSKKPTIGIGITKQDMIFSLNNDLLSTIEFEAKEQVAAFYSEDLKEGVTAFLEKRKANFKGK